MSFIDPERLWVLLIVPFFIVAYIWAVRRKHHHGIRFTNTALLAQVVPRQRQWRRHVAVALSLLSLVALIMAWARPNGIDYVPRERATIVLVVDVSQSMTSTDVSPTRLDAAKQAALTFGDQLPAAYNLALVSLSGNPALILPPTIDRTQFHQAVNSLKPQDSTAIGESIYVALSAMQLAPKGTDNTPAPGAIVLLSDGDNNIGRAPVQAAAAAAAKKIPIYTIAYGTALGYVDLPAEGDQPATRATVPPDPNLMSELARISGGQTFSASSLGQLNQVYASIHSEVGRQPVEKEVTATWAGYGLAFAALAALAAVSLGARWP